MAQINIVISLLAFFLPLCISYTFPNERNRCTIYNGGCAFHVLLSGSDCDMVRDAPAVPSYYQKSVQEVQQVTAKVAASKEDEETKESLKKLDSLERKLLKMMEGLSVRSLRHIRQIKTELREVTNAINLMQHQNKPKKGVTCPANFISVGAWSSCYRFSTFNTTWHQAREYCSAFGSDLVSLDTEKESYILDYLLRSNPGEIEFNKFCFILRTKQQQKTKPKHKFSMKLNSVPSSQSYSNYEDIMAK